MRVATTKVDKRKSFVMNEIALHIHPSGMGVKTKKCYVKFVVANQDWTLRDIGPTMLSRD